MDDATKQAINKMHRLAEDINIDFYDLFLSADKPELFAANRSKIDANVRLLHSEWLAFMDTK